MEPLIVIPDLQGEYEMLIGILEALKDKDLLKGRRLAFLGDYLDRGDGSKPLLDLLMELKNDGAIFVRGNHEDIFIKAVMADEVCDEFVRDMWIYQWLKIENNTLFSYGISREGKTGLNIFNLFKDKLEGLGHMEFLYHLPYYVEYENIILVHAGIKDDSMWVGQKAQLDKEILEIDSMPEQVYSFDLAELVYHTENDKCVVSGHSTRAKPFVSNKRVMLDCGAGKPGKPLVAWVSDTNEAVYYYKK